MYLSSQLFFITPEETLQFQEKYIKNAFSSNQFFSSVSTMDPLYRATELSKTVKKRDLWGKAAVVKRSCIKTFW